MIIHKDRNLGDCVILGKMIIQFCTYWIDIKSISFFTNGKRGLFQQQ